MTLPKPSPAPRRDPFFISDRDAMACPVCYGRGSVGDGQGKWEATHGAWHPVRRACNHCLGRGLVEAK